MYGKSDISNWELNVTLTLVITEETSSFKISRKLRIKKVKAYVENFGSFLHPFKHFFKSLLIKPLS